MKQTIRERVQAAIEAMTDDHLERLMVARHDAHTHEWIEVYPDGDINETEEPDNLTTHWIDYPDKEVATLFEIHGASGAACNCDMCHVLNHFDDMDREEFEERYPDEDWEYINDHSREELIVMWERDNDYTIEDLRDEILAGLEDIEYGYFDDEEESYGA